MATPVEVPNLGDSVKQAILLVWHKADGDLVSIDEPICELETDKANVDLPAPASGLLRQLKQAGDSVAVGETIGRIDSNGAAAKLPQTPLKDVEQGAAANPAVQPVTAAQSPTASEDLSPAVRALVMEHGLDPKSLRGTGPHGRLTREDVETHIASKGSAAGGRASADVELIQDRAAGDGEPHAPAVSRPIAPPPARPRETSISTAPAKTGVAAMDLDANGDHRAPMSKIRKRIAQTLVAAQQTAAILTTFNEIDMTGVMDLRSKYKERFQEVHGIGLGFMSFFARAAVLALREFPRVNAFLEGDDVVYHNYVHLGIAVSTDRGLAVPVLRNVQDMSFARIENEIKRLATAVRDGKLGLDELSGGTFTITNGGVFGSLLSTPILNPPQSGILGMHAIQKRPVAIHDKVEIRGMMYIALSYDHRLVDGRESVSFLVRLKQLIEDPARLMLEI